MKKTLLIATIALFIFSGCNKDDAKNKLESPFLSTLSGGRNHVGMVWSNVTGATSYNIYRSSSESGTFSRISNESGERNEYTIIEPNGVFTFKYQFMDQSPFSGYNYYRVTAVYGDKESAPSNILNINLTRN